MSTELVSSLKELHLYGMATAYQEWAAHPQPVAEPVAWLTQFVTAEKQDRYHRSLRYQRRIAHFPLQRSLDEFDFTESPIAETDVRNLAEGLYLEAAHNVILVGGTGTGKTHLALALGHAAIDQSKRVRWYNVVDLVNYLEQEKNRGQGGRLVKTLQGMDLVILDELGYLPFSESGAPCSSI